MQTVSAKTVLATFPQTPVSIRYRERGGADAHASFASLAIALQALCYDAHVENLLAVTVHAPDGPLALSRQEADALMEALRQPADAGTAADDDRFDMESLAGHVETFGALEFSRFGRWVTIPLDRYDPS